MGSRQGNRLTTGPKHAIDVDVASNAFRLVRVEGEIDLASSTKFEGALGAEPGKDVIVDLSDVKFMDSTGVRSMVSANEAHSKAKRRFVLVFDDGPVQRILELTGLLQRFETYSTVEAATAALEQ